MAETTLSPAPAAPPAAGRVVRIVLFGRSRSGKSALLAALAEVVLRGGGELKADLSAADGQIERLGKDEAEAGAPIVAYKARYRPEGAGAEGTEVVFLDCEGRAASELLASVEELEEDQPELPLAR